MGSRGGGSADWVGRLNADLLQLPQEEDLLLAVCHRPVSAGQAARAPRLGPAPKRRVGVGDGSGSWSAGGWVGAPHFNNPRRTTSASFGSFSTNWVTQYDSCWWYMAMHLGLCSGSSARWRKTWAAGADAYFKGTIYFILFCGTAGEEKGEALAAGGGGSSAAAAGGEHALGLQIRSVPN